MVVEEMATEGRGTLGNAPRQADLPPTVVGWVFSGIGCGVITLRAGVAVLKLRVARGLQRRRGQLFRMGVGALGCLESPCGTALDVATPVVLGRPSVTPLFETRLSQKPPEA